LVSGLPGVGREDFAAAYVDAVRGGLDKVLGVSGTSAVLFHMKMAKNFPNPEEFNKKLLTLFGVQGTLSLERAILKDLAKRLGWTLDLHTIEGAFDFDMTMQALEKGVQSR
jgi:hypothetical protein